MEEKEVQIMEEKYVEVGIYAQDDYGCCFYKTFKMPKDYGMMMLVDRLREEGIVKFRTGDMNKMVRI